MKKLYLKWKWYESKDHGARFSLSFNYPDKNFPEDIKINDLEIIESAYTGDYMLAILEFDEKKYTDAQIRDNLISEKINEYHEIESRESAKTFISENTNLKDEGDGYYKVRESYTNEEGKDIEEKYLTI